MARQKPKSDGAEKRRGHGEGSWIYLDELDKWKFRVSAKTPDGITKRFAVTAATKTECRELAKTRAEQIEKGIGLNVDTKNITVKEYLDRWVLDNVDPNASASTRRVYRSMIKNCLTDKIGEIQLKRLRRPACQRHFNELAKSGRSSSSVKLAFVVLHSCLKQAVEDKIISENPAQGVKLQQVVNRERMAYSAEEVKKVLRLVADHRYRIGFHLLFSVALREGELLGLRWKNVDLAKCEINIVEQLSRVAGIVYGPLKTKKSKRILPISVALAGELKACKTRQKEILLKAGVVWNEEMSVMTNSIGQPIKHNSFYEDYLEVMKEAGLESTGTHDARHTCLSLLGTSNIDAKTLSRFAGHASSSFTLDVYVTESFDAAVTAVGKLDQLIHSAK